jgi:choice-of-anchor B domain-containing protein
MTAHRVALLGLALAVSSAPIEAAVVRCVNGMANGFPCKNVDLMSFLPHSTWNGVTNEAGNDIWGWRDPLTNREYALVGTSKGTAFVDVTVADSPVYVGFLPAPPAGGAAPEHDCVAPLGPIPEHCGGDSQWRDLEVYADHAYIGSEQAGHGLVVFDLRQLRGLTGNPPVTFADTFRYLGVGQSHTITVNPQSGFVYINGSRSAVACAPGPTNTGGPVILNAAVPGAPTFAGCDLTDGYTHDSQCVTYNGPDLDYAGREICMNSNEDDLTITDVTNTSAAAVISRTTYAGHGYVHQGWLTPDHRHFVVDDELDENNFNHNTKTYIFDVQDLDAPQLIGTHVHGTLAIDHNQFIVGNLVYQSNYRAGLRILETRDIAAGQLSEVAFFDNFPANNNRGFNGTWANYPFFPSGTVVVNTIEGTSGLFVLRPSLADVKVTVQPPAVPPVPGQEVTYRFLVSNSGPVSGTNTVFRYAIQGGSVRSATSTRGSCARLLNHCRIGSLGKGQTAVIDLVVRPLIPEFWLRGLAQADEADTRPDDNAVQHPVGPITRPPLLR